MDQVNLLAPKLLKLRLWPDLKDPTKQWASSVVDNGYAPRFAGKLMGPGTAKKCTCFCWCSNKNCLSTGDNVL